MKKELLRILVLILACLFLFVGCDFSANGGSKDITEGTTEGMGEENDTESAEIEESPYEFELLADQTYGIKIGLATDAEEIVIPGKYRGKPVTRVLENGFKAAQKLKKLTIPSEIKEIGDSAFYECTELESLTISQGLTDIGNYAFRECDALISVTIPEGVISIGEKAFASCNNLQSISLPGSLKHIGESLFDGCLSLKEVALPNGLASFTLTKSMFSHCPALTSFTIPEGVETIEGYAFNQCLSLTSITIPRSVMSIESGVFGACLRLSNITFTGTKAEWEAVYKEEDWDRNTRSYVVTCTDGQITK